MKKSTFFFLVLVLAAAVVTGSTLSVISNFELIKSAAQNQSTINNASSENAQQIEPADVHKDNASVQTASATTDASTELMVVSPEESAEITSMLVNLGMTCDTDSGKFIKQYQVTHGIQPTGNMDSITLSSIINDVKIERATQLTNQ